MRAHQIAVILIIACVTHTFQSAANTGDEGRLGRFRSLDLCVQMENAYIAKTKDASQDNFEVCPFYGMKCRKDQAFCDPLGRTCTNVAFYDKAVEEKERICRELEKRDTLKNDYGNRTVCNFIMAQQALKREKALVKMYQSRTDNSTKDNTDICVFSLEECQKDKQYCDPSQRKCVNVSFHHKPIEEREKECLVLQREGKLAHDYGTRTVCNNIRMQQAAHREKALVKMYESRTYNSTKDNTDICVFSLEECQKDKQYCDPSQRKCVNVSFHYKPIEEREKECLKLQREGKLAHDYGTRTVCNNIRMQQAASSASRERYDGPWKTATIVLGAILGGLVVLFAIVAFFAVYRYIKKKSKKRSQGNRDSACREAGSDCEREGLVQSGSTPTSITQPGPTTSVTQSGPTSTSVTQSGPTSTSVTQSGSTPPNVTQPGSMPSVTQQGPTPNVTQQSPTPNVTQPGLTPNVTQPDPTPNVTQPGPTPNVTQQGPTPPNVTQPDPTPNVTQPGLIPNVTLPGPTPNVTQPDPTPNVTQPGLIPNVTLPGPTPNVTQTDPTQTNITQARSKQAEATPTCSMPPDLTNSDSVMAHPAGREQQLEDSVPSSGQPDEQDRDIRGMRGPRPNQPSSSSTHDSANPGEQGLLESSTEENKFNSLEGVVIIKDAS